MSSELSIDWSNLQSMFDTLDLIGEQGAKIDTFFGTYVCDPSGFKYDLCALQPLADVMGTVAGWFSDMRGTFDDRWAGVGQALAYTAHQVDLTDDAVSYNLGRHLGVMGPYLPSGLPTNGALTPAVFDIDEPALDEPADGEQQLPGHDKTFQAIAEGWDATRDGINDFIAKINGPLGAVGQHLEPLQTKSLEQYIVFPLSGDYKRIQRNGAACTTVKTAMATWGGNFSKVSLQVGAVMRGEASLAMIAQLNVYNAVMKTIGVIVSGGTRVYGEIAKMSERIAIEVEKVIIVLGKKLASLLLKLSSRVGGMLAWAKLAVDLAAKGTDVIMDIVDDVKTVWNLISSCFELVDSVREWAEEQAARLHAFEELVTAIGELPGIGPMTSYDGMDPADLDAIQKTLDDIVADFGTDDGPAGDALEDDLGGLVEDSGYEPEPDPDAPNQALADLLLGPAGIDPDTAVTAPSDDSALGQLLLGPLETPDPAPQPGAQPGQPTPPAQPTPAR